MAFEVEFLVIGVLIGVLLGVFVLYALLAKRLDARAEGIAQGRAVRMFEQQRAGLETQFREMYGAKLEEWKATELVETVGRARQDAVDKQRYVVKGKVGEQMAPLFPESAERYDPADARFIGSPVDYIIFDNLSQVADGSDLPLEVVLLDIKTGEKAALTAVQRRIRDAVEARRVRWETMKLSLASESEQAPLPTAKPGGVKISMVVGDGQAAIVCPNCRSRVVPSDAKLVANQLWCPSCGKSLTKR